MGAAPELEIVDGWRPPEREGLPVMELEAADFAASLAAVIAVSASLAIAVPNNADYRRRNVAISAPSRRGDVRKGPRW